MKTVTDIYTEYKIMPFLQLHQLRVAAVAQMVVRNFEKKLDERSVTIAGLFHDMGNILKSNFSLLPESCEPEGMPYWEHVKADFLNRYGPDEHHATVAIAHELHLPLQAMKYMENIGFSKMELIRDHPSFELKVVEYADCRVSPHGVVAMDERFDESHTRYKNKPGATESDPERFKQVIDAGHEIEGQIFAKTRIKPADITEAAVQSLIEELKHFQV